MVHHRKYNNNKKYACTKGTFPTPVFSNFSIYILQHCCRCRQFHGRHHLRDNIEAIIVNLKWFLMSCHNCHFSRTDIYCEFKEICIPLAPPKGGCQKLLSGFFLLRGYPPPSPPTPLNGKSFCQKTLSGKGGTPKIFLKK